MRNKQDATDLKTQASSSAHMGRKEDKNNAPGSTDTNRMEKV